EEGANPRPHRLQRALQLGAEDDAGDPLGHLALELLVDGVEQLGLAAEVVVEGAAGDAGGADDLLGADRVVAALGKQATSGGHEGRARRFGSFRLSATSVAGPPPAGIVRIIRGYIHAVCMLKREAHTRIRSEAQG